MQENRPEYYGANADPTPDHWWQRLTEIWALLARADSRAQQDNDLRTYVDEYVYLQGVPSVILPRTTDNPVVLRKLIVWTDQPSAVIRLGTMRQFNVGTGLSVLDLSGVIIKDSDVVSMTLPNAGALFIEMTGRQLPVVTL